MTTPNHRDPGVHPRHRLQPVLHSPVRLSIIACLVAAEKAEFGFVRDTVELSDSALSKQVSVLERAGYVKAKKGYVGKFPRTWLSLTPAGRRRFDAHLAALTAIAGSPPVGARPGRSDRDAA
jgi:DNA-binding MarR family transcriptional regulator